MKTIDAVNLALNLLIQAQKISMLVTQAQAKGRTTLTAEESKAIRADRDAAFDRLDALLDSEKSDA